MARIVLVGVGTFGDHLPLIGLGQELVRRGHAVVMAVNAAMRGGAERAGLDVVEVGSVLGAEQARRAARDWDHWTIDPAATWRWTDASDGRQVDDCRALRAACTGADVLVAPVNDLTGWLVQECSGIPRVTVALGAGMLAGWPSPGAPGDGPACDGGAGLSPMDRSLAEHLGRVRYRLGLPDRPLARQFDGWLSDRLLLACNAAFAGPLAAHCAHATVTGFWLPDDPAWTGWTPPSELRSFVETEPRPLTLSFSSLPLVDPAAVLAVHARAAARLDRRLVVVGGWAAFSADDLPADVRRDDVLFVDTVPHDWLFAHVDAAIVHGGIGSVARALRAGCPLVVEPYGNDQFFNARQVLSLGLGVAMHPHRVTPGGLARVLGEKVLTPACRARVAAFGRSIAAEDGLAAGASAIEGWLVDLARPGALRG